MTNDAAPHVSPLWENPGNAGARASRRLERSNEVAARFPTDCWSPRTTRVSEPGASAADWEARLAEIGAADWAARLAEIGAADWAARLAEIGPAGSTCSGTRSGTTP